MEGTTTNNTENQDKTNNNKKDDETNKDTSTDNNSNNNNNDNTNTTKKEDHTIATDKLPNTGLSIAMILVIAVVITGCIFGYFKYNKLKGV